MFDFEATCRKLGIWDEDDPNAGQDPAAIRAIPAIPDAENSRNSQNSRTSYSVSNTRKTLEVAKRLYRETRIIPLTEDEIADRKIDKLKLRDDRNFMYETLKGTYGKDRLALVNQYFNEWHKGVESEPTEVKKENAGRRRANTWLRQERGKDKFCQLTATDDSLQATTERSETEPG
jgi:hypothetical protein